MEQIRLDVAGARVGWPPGRPLRGRWPWVHLLPSRGRRRAARVVLAFGDDGWASTGNALQSNGAVSAIVVLITALVATFAVALALAWPLRASAAGAVDVHGRGRVLGARRASWLALRLALALTFELVLDQRVDLAHQRFHPHARVLGRVLALVGELLGLRGGDGIDLGLPRPATLLVEVVVDCILVLVVRANVPVLPLVREISLQHFWADVFQAHDAIVICHRSAAPEVDVVIQALLPARDCLDHRLKRRLFRMKQRAALVSKWPFSNAASLIAQAPPRLEGLLRRPRDDGRVDVARRVGLEVLIELRFEGIFDLLGVHACGLPDLLKTGVIQGLVRQRLDGVQDLFPPPVSPRQEMFEILFPGLPLGSSKFRWFVNVFGIHVRQVIGTLRTPLAS